MNTKQTYSWIWRVTYPIIIGLVAQNIMLVIDTAFLGRLGAVTLGAAAIGGVFFLCIVMLGTGFSVGVQILVGRRNGELNYDKVGLLMTHAFCMAIIIAGLSFAIIKFLAPEILTSFVDSNAILSESLIFLNYRKYGLFFGFLVLTFNALYIGTIRTSIVSASTIVMAAVNIVLDYGLIFGNLGMPEMGIAGAALATNIAELVAFVFYVIYSYYLNTFKKYGFIRSFIYNKQIVSGLLRISLPVMLQYFFSFSAWFVFFLIIEKQGEVALAASNIARSIYMVLMIPVWGLSSSINTLVSNTIGQGKAGFVIPLIKKVVVIGLLCSIVMVAFPLISPEIIVSFYTDDQLVINATIPLVYVIVVALMVFSVAMILFSSLSGTGKTLLALKIEIVCIFLYLVSAYFIAVVLKGSTPVVWMVEIIYFFLMGVFALYFILKGKWKELKI